MSVEDNEPGGKRGKRRQLSEKKKKRKDRTIKEDRQFPCFVGSKRY